MDELGCVEEERAYVVGEAEGVVVGHGERAKVGKGWNLLGFDGSSGRWKAQTETFEMAEGGEAAIDGLEGPSVQFPSMLVRYRCTVCV